jgi:hypothetical protein
MILDGRQMFYVPVLVHIPDDSKLYQHPLGNLKFWKTLAYVYTEVT